MIKVPKAIIETLINHIRVGEMISYFTFFIYLYVYIFYNRDRILFSKRFSNNLDPKNRDPQRHEIFRESLLEILDPISTKIIKFVKKFTILFQHHRHIWRPSWKRNFDAYRWKICWPRVSRLCLSAWNVSKRLRCVNLFWYHKLPYHSNNEFLIFFIENLGTGRGRSCDQQCALLIKLKAWKMK